MSDNIRAALSKLTPVNDDHWTAEGLPRLDVMKELLGVAVSRSDITAAAKEFTRKNPVTEPVVVADKPENTGSGESSGNVQDEQLPEVHDTPPAVVPDELDGDEAVEAELVNAQLQVDKAQKRLLRATGAMDVVITRRSVGAAGNSLAHTVKLFQASQAAQRGEQVDKMKILALAMAATKNKV